MFKFNKNKKLYITIITIISILILSISCKNTMTDSTNEGNNGDNISTIDTNANNGNTNNDGNTTVKTTVQYGSKSATIDVSNYEEIKKLWMEVFANKKIYSSAQLTTETGWTVANGDYHENKYQSGQSARTSYVTNVIIKFQETNYIAGVYYDNYNQYNMPNDWRLIVIGDDGTEHAWYGGGRDRNNIPNENTAWTYYTFRFGWLKYY